MTQLAVLRVGQQEKSNQSGPPYRRPILRPCHCLSLPANDEGQRLQAALALETGHAAAAIPCVGCLPNTALRPYLINSYVGHVSLRAHVLTCQDDSVLPATFDTSHRGVCSHKLRQTPGSTRGRAKLARLSRPPHEQLPSRRHCCGVVSTSSDLTNALSQARENGALTSLIGSGSSRTTLFGSQQSSCNREQ